MKMYKGKSGKIRWRWNFRGLREKLLWAATRKVKDLFLGCDLKNHVIKNIIITRRSYKKGWAIINVEFESEDGSYHEIRNGCADYPWSEQQIITYRTKPIPWYEVEDKLLSLEECEKIKAENPNILGSNFIKIDPVIEAFNTNRGINA